MSRRPFNLLRSFGLLSLASIIVVGIVSCIGVLRYVTNHMFEREATVTMQFIQSMVDASQTALGVGDLGDFANKKARLTELLEHISLIPDVVRANVYALDRALIWSTENSLIGKRFELNDALEKALQGQLVFERVRLGDTIKAEHAFFGDDVTDFIEIYVPIWNPGRSRVIGVAELYRTPDGLFRAIEQGRLIVVIGGSAGGLLLYAVLFWIVHRGNRLINEQERRLESEIAEHKRDKQTLRRSERARRVLSAKLLGAQEQERKRIAAELHDGLGQSLSAIKFDLERGLRELGSRTGQSGGLAVMNASVWKVRDAAEEVRRISMDLRPSILDDLGILATIDWFCREFQSVHPHVRITKHIGLEEAEVPDALKVVIYRVVQEAVNNVAKHAGANEVRLELVNEPDHIRLSIRDNGRGFSTQASTHGEGEYGGIGLQSMHERAEFSRGEFSIDSQPGEGTNIQIVWRRSNSVSAARGRASA